MTTHNATLMAISMGAVYFGALTYIGNAPNFMIKAVAEDRGIAMPSFFGYVFQAGVVMLPLLAVIGVALSVTVVRPPANRIAFIDRGQQIPGGLPPRRCLVQICLPSGIGRQGHGHRRAFTSFTLESQPAPCASARSRAAVASACHRLRSWTSRTQANRSRTWTRQ